MEVKQHFLEFVCRSVAASEARRDLTAGGKRIKWGIARDNREQPGQTYITFNMKIKRKNEARGGEEVEDV